MTTGVPRVGRAFVASGLTLVAGVAVLALSPMPLLRDFGVAATLHVLFALVSTLVLLQPLLVWADRHGWLRLLAVGSDRAGMRDPATDTSPDDVRQGSAAASPGQTG